MNEGFDKEAERERLRKKYEADREDREATERMSELLLQGATMTNKHCDSCGSPIFRHEGTEFCPSCQYQAQGEGETQQTGGEASEQTTAKEAQPATDPSQQTEDEGTQRTAEGDTRKEAQAGSSRSKSAETDQETLSDTDRRPISTGSADSPPAVTREETQTATAHLGPENSGAGQTASQNETVQTLRGTIMTLAKRATETSDPRRAKEFLEAAGEAADALETLQDRS